MGRSHFWVPRQRARHAITKPGDRVIVPSRARFELQFAGDTFITLPDAGIIFNDAIDSLSYTARLNERAGRNRYVWSTDAGTDYSAFWLSGDNLRLFRGNTGQNLVTVTPLIPGLQVSIVEQWGPIGTMTATVTNFGSESTVGLGTANPVGTWKIGERAASIGDSWLGMIRDFRIISSAGDVKHHWPINDNVIDGGTIKDVVGGEDGILTLGAGSWQKS